MLNHILDLDRLAHLGLDETNRFGDFGVFNGHQVRGTSRYYPEWFYCNTARGTALAMHELV